MRFNYRTLRKLLVGCFSCLYMLSFAQKTTIIGRIVDSEQNELIGANVVLMRPQDSVVVTGTQTDIDGYFEFDATEKGRFLLEFSYVGYKTLYKSIVLNQDTVKAGKIVLEEDQHLLKEVVIVQEADPVTIKGDTTQFNASAYKTNPDANVEDLVTKMPGIVIQDGKVQAQGEDVKKVLVDGRPFLGDDPNAALKNLPAEVVQNIQVFDQKSDMSLFTGFDDGNTTKTINIVTKPSFRNGTFGKAYAGLGDDDKYKAGGNINFFKDKRRISILAQSNNINEQNFSQDDLLGVMSSSGNSSGGGGMRRPGGGPRPGGGGGNNGGNQGGNDVSNFLVNSRNGITKTHAFGINYLDSWGKKIEISGSYFFNYSENKSISDVYRTYLQSEYNGLNYTENSTAESKNINHRANFKFDYKIDSFNSLLIQPVLSFQTNDGSSVLFGLNKLVDVEQNKTSVSYLSNLTGYNISVPILYKHAFNKKGRTITANITPSFNPSKGNNDQNSLSSSVSDMLVDTIEQVSYLDKKGNNISGGLSYTEPIGKKSMVQASYNVNYNYTDSERRTNDVNGGEETLNPKLSSQFTNEYFNQSFGGSYRLFDEKQNLTAGLAWQWSSLNNKAVLPLDITTQRTFQNLLPNLSYQYKFSKTQNIRLNIRANTNAPSISQLQDVEDYSNPTQIKKGNPLLDQQTQYNLNLRFSSTNPTKMSNFFVGLGGNITSDYIGNNTRIFNTDTVLASGLAVTSGSQLITPQNMGQSYSLRAFGNYGFPVKSIKSNLNFNLFARYSYTPSINNSIKFYTSSPSVGMGVFLSSNISERVDFSISTNGNYTSAINSQNTASNSRYYTQNSSLRVNYMPIKSIVINTDFSHQYNDGLGSTADQTFILWNAAIAYKFLKNKAAELRLSVYDILNQNKSVQYNVTDTYIENTQSNVLKRYFMLTFTYQIKAFQVSGDSSKGFQGGSGGPGGFGGRPGGGF